MRGYNLAEDLSLLIWVNLIPLFGVELFEGIERRYLTAVFIESAIRAIG
jgi:hypothetical protein